MENLNISDFRNEPLPHTFFRQDPWASHVAVLLPGLNYTSHMPLLYYPTRLLLSAGVDVLQVEYDYSTRADFRQLSSSQRQTCLFADSENACNAALAQRNYQQVTIIGKSIGTSAMGHLLTTSDSLTQSRAVWLTPLLKDDILRGQIKECAQPSLFVIGTADPNYDRNYLAEVKEATGGEVLVIEGADHSLEIQGNTLQSLDALEQFLTALKTFLN